MLRPVRLLGLLLTVSALLALCASSARADRRREVRGDATASAFRPSKVKIPVRDPAPPPGARVLNYRFGPMKIQPGQNLIDIDVQKERPNVDGWIVGFRPGLVDAKTGKSPNVDEVHLHHAVWLLDNKLTFAAGEEKTYFNAPAGYGWRYTTRQPWFVNHMIHDLVGEPHEVDLTYTLYFIPDSAPEAAGIKRITTRWMDVQGVKPYPVFNAERGAGKGGRFTYPDQAQNPYPDGKIRNKWTVDRDATLVAGAGHLHPGGLWTDLKVTRAGRTVRVFRSRANYFDRAGAVSWDVAMSATSPSWRVALKQGDVLSTTATYDTTKASWYEVMGIMVIGITDGPDGGVDPFTGHVDQTDYLTHARLPENIERGVGKRTPAFHNPLRLRQGPFRSKVTIRNFVYTPGALALSGREGLPPSVRQGQQLTFVNRDEPLTVRFHTITACKAPCNRSSGIKYPLADGTGQFDSGELGYGPTINTEGFYEGGDVMTPISPVLNIPAPAARCAGNGPKGLVAAINNGCIGAARWKTPKSLGPGTYSYFCRVHPFMRGAFKVVPSERVKG
jgi:plastocyanin